ncbi:hypothetical protein LguiA_027493 [Lonicera macranthoides]
MVGEIGGNDYNYALFQGKTIKEVEDMVPDVVQAIKDAAQRVIHKGAVRLVIPGNFPIGCMPIYLTEFESNNSNAYDGHHCLKKLNKFSEYHNRHLQRAIEELRLQNPGVKIAYGDYYHSFHWLFHNAESLGFDSKLRQKACCGTGGNYNFNMTRMCGAPQVPACTNPAQHLSWDGVHLTQRAYKMMANQKSNRDIPIQCGYGAENGNTTLQQTEIGNYDQEVFKSQSSNLRLFQFRGLFSSNGLQSSEDRALLANSEILGRPLCQKMHRQHGRLLPTPPDDGYWSNFGWKTPHNSLENMIEPTPITNPAQSTQENLDTKDAAGS